MTTCVRRLLRKVGLLPEFTIDERVQADTDNTRHDLDRTFGKLSEENRKFAEASDRLVRRIEDRKTDIEIVLEHVRKASRSNASAEELLRRMVERNGQ